MQNKNNLPRKEFLVILILSISLSIIIGYYLFRKTDNNFLYFLYPVIIVFLSIMLISDEANEILKREKLYQTKVQYLCFFEDFYLFSAIENSYQLGFQKAYEQLKPSKLKKQLTEFLDENEEKLNLSFEENVLPRQDEIVEQCYRLYRSKECFTKEDCQKISRLLQQARSN